MSCVCRNLPLGLRLSMECKGPWGQDHVFKCETRSYKWGKVQGMEHNDSKVHSQPQNLWKERLNELR